MPINRASGQALATTMARKGSDKKSFAPKVKARALSYPVISTYRTRESGSLPLKHYPVNARQPHWSSDRDSATAREERAAMLTSGPITGAWKEHNRSGCKLDRSKHAKALRAVAEQARNVAKVRRMLD